MKFSKRKLNIIINTIFIIYLVISFIYNFSILLIDAKNDIEVFKQLSTLKIVLSFISAIFICIFVVILNNIYVIAIYLGIKLAIKKFYKNKLDKNDLEKYTDYYRNLINDYSIGVLDYLDDFVIDYNSLYIAYLLKLQNDGILKINNNSIELLDEPKNESDKLFIDSIIDNKIVIDNNTFKSQIIKEAILKNLIVTDKKNIKFKFLFIFFICIIFLPFIFSMFINSISGITSVNFLNSVLIVLIAVFFITLPATIIFVITYFITHTFKKINDPYIRTEKGSLINERLEGLKNFLKDFSDLENKSSEEIKLWNDYLVYSVMFNQNEKILNEYRKFL